MTSNLTAPVHDTQHFGSRPELAVADWSHGWPWPIHSSGSCQPGPGSVDGLRGGLRISWSRGQLSVVWCLRVSAETPGARFEHLDPADGDPPGGTLNRLARHKRQLVPPGTHRQWPAANHRALSRTRHALFWPH
ncbi:hypothetical protein MHUMG1_04740 [Metarhizium humberi]|uniref:Uncharacterized protein n=1 Tax=Metarhizium humberi TaxID=2596975 RepID=A0A9P8S7X3_9HYPO|nr:hypothetical protein MHUMG1_04740 [Metarhizium humberi]